MRKMPVPDRFHAEKDKSYCSAFGRTVADKNILKK